ncbi:MAG: glycosyltransferase family 4 protein [Bryobacteraceae bacterium]|nr:glycosyltransferase family 4 protein [Bryobacteraceae bacterium]
MSQRSIHVFASDSLPFPGCPRTAGGQRSMQVISALRQAGHRVTFSYNTDAFIAKKWADKLNAHLSDEDRWCCEHYNQPEVVLNRLQPDIAIYCNVNTFQTVLRFARDIVHIVDLYGPVHFEALTLTNSAEAADRGDRVEAQCRGLVDRLREADHIVTVSERQKYFWLAYCSLAGFSFSELDALICPFCFETEALERRPSENLSIVHAGGFYPWQNPERYLRAAAEYLDGIPGAKLHIAGGPHAGTPNEKQTEQMLRELEAHPSVAYHGFLAVEEFTRLLSSAWAAVDLIERTLERELAITGRTLQFLSTGVPVIYNDYATLSAAIREYRAGWAIPTHDPAALKPVIDELVQGGKPLVEELTANALRLAKERFDPIAAMRPLVEICGSVGKRASRTPSRRAGSRGKAAPVGKVLALSRDTGAIAELRMNNPLRALHRQRLIDGFFASDAAGERLARDNSLYEAILIQRTVPESVWLAFANLELPYLLDVDDNLLACASYRKNDPEPSQPWLFTGLRYATAVTTPNPRLVRLLEKYSHLPLAGRAYLAPNALPYGSSQSIASPSQPAQILWIQSDIAALSNSRDAVIRAVEDFSRKYNLPVVLIGKNVLERPRFTHQVAMGEIDFNSNLQLLGNTATSIGVAPLETDADPETIDFVSGKSDLKILLFSGFGHPGVFSHSPPYSDSPFHDCVTLVGNTYQEWIEALELQYREGWKSVAASARRIQDERNIDRVARESWAPAIEACVLPRPIRGADVHEALKSYNLMQADPARALGYLVANPDVGREFVTSDQGAWEHYAEHGQNENRGLLHEADAHWRLLSALDAESEDLFRRGKSRLAQAQTAASISYMQHEIQRLRSEVQDLRASYSWKITAPLRAIAKPVMGRLNGGK